MDVAAQDWLRLFDGAAPEAAAWASAHADDPARGWDECPSGDWLVGAAARAGLPAREILGALHALLAAVFDELASRGVATEPALARALDAADAWLEGRLGVTELAEEEREVSASGGALARALALATLHAASHDAAPAAADPRAALAERAGDVIRALAARAGDKGQPLAAALVREQLPWGVIAATLARPPSGA